MFRRKRLKKNEEHDGGGLGATYAGKTLQPDEHLVYISRFHWIYTFRAIAPLLGSIIIVIIAALAGLILPFLLVLCLPIFFAAAHALNQLSYKWVNKVVVTNKRLIIQRGWRKRNTTDLGLDRILGYKIDEDATGRTLNYGKVILFGAGVGQVDLFPYMADTLQLCKALNKELPAWKDQAKSEKKARWFRPAFRGFARNMR
ncbi:MAG: PH domain-containing protein [Pseudomonadota bacterium]